jgi:hypothetical protein
VSLQILWLFWLYDGFIKLKKLPAFFVMMDIDNPADIAFPNLVITDLDHSATPSQMRDAALRHLQSGKSFFMYGHSATPEHEYHNMSLFPSLYPTLFPFGVGGFEDKR